MRSSGKHQARKPTEFEFVASRELCVCETFSFCVEPATFSAALAGLSGMTGF